MIYVKSIILKPTRNVEWVEIDETSTYAHFRGWLLFAAATTTVPSKMSVCDGGRPPQQRAITLENEHTCSFSRVIGGGACAQNECGGWPNVTPLPMGSKKLVSTQIIGISKRTYLVGG